MQQRVTVAITDSSKILSVVQQMLKTPQPFHKIETGLALPVQFSGVFVSLQFVVSVYSKLFIVLHYMDGNGDHNHFIGLCHIELQMVLLAPHVH